LSDAAGYKHQADLEEGMLEKIHPEYKAYQECTKRYMQLIY
jgi:hypothetical protein